MEEESWQEIEKKPVKITETILRDAHQSLIATRMTTEQMLPIIDKRDKSRLPLKKVRDYTYIYIAFVS